MLSNILDTRQPGYARSITPVQPPAWSGQTRAHQPQTEPASALVSNPYSQLVQFPHSRPPQRLPSPPDSMEEAKESKKFSLPGINNLLTGLRRDEDRSHADASLRRLSDESLGQSQETSTINTNRLRFPPTPPLRPESSFNGDNQSPRSLSSHQSSYSNTTTNPYYGASAINNMEPYSQRQMTYPPITHKRPSVTSQGYSPYSSSSVNESPAASTNSYQISPIETPPSSGLLYQRPLPTNFPPSFAPQQHHHMLSSYPSLPPWQQQSHHHHFPPSSIAPYPQSPDRYICPQCNKAFSRPSSLKIHSHSHTGEKPFKCGHPNCGKAFSVRSNMKRHEKGCHGGDGHVVPMIGRI